MTHNPLYSKLIERVLSERPDLAPYAELFQQASNNTDNNNDESRMQQLEAKYRRLLSSARFLKEDLDDANDYLDEFAGALGACNECWGEDKRCRKCKGKGIAGFLQPHKELFDRLILPALYKVPWLEIKEIKVVQKTKRSENRRVNTADVKV